MNMRAGRATEILGGKTVWWGLALIGAGLLIKAFGDQTVRRLVSPTEQPAGPRRRAGCSRVHIDCPVRSVYDFIREPENAPKYMPHIDDVERHDERHARWIMRTPGGIRVGWEGRLVEDQPSKRLVWEWRERGRYAGAMTVQLSSDQDSRGTIADAAFHYEVTSAPLETVFAELLPDPTAHADTTLRQLKRFLETPAREPLEPVAEREGINQGGQGSGLNL